MYANFFGTKGVRHAIDLFKFEIATDAARHGLADIYDVKLKHFARGAKFLVQLDTSVVQILFMVNLVHNLSSVP